VSADRQPLYGIRRKEGERTPFSLLAEAELCTEGTSPDSRIVQTITATIAVGPFDRRTLFLTHEFELVASLILFGVGTDFEESFYISDFSEPFRCRDLTPGGNEIEVFDMLSGESVKVSADDPRLTDVVRAMAQED
jgi:hypothetical protein